MTVLSSAVAYHISALCRERGIAIDPSSSSGAGEMAPLWVKYHAYLAGQVRRINEALKLAAAGKVPSMFLLIRDLLILTDVSNVPTKEAENLWHPISPSSPSSESSIIAFVGL